MVGEFLKRILVLCFSFTLLFLHGCSFIERCVYFEPHESSSRWSVYPNDKYKAYYEHTTHFYSSCDTNSSIRIDFTNTVGPLFWGLTPLPIIPTALSRGRYMFHVSISVKTDSITDVEKIASYIHCTINDSVSFKPSNVFKGNNQNVSDKNFYTSICDDKSKTNTRLWILLRYPIHVRKVRNVRVTFEPKLNELLQSNHQPLELTGHYFMKYSPFVFYFRGR